MGPDENDLPGVPVEVDRLVGRPVGPHEQRADHLGLMGGEPRVGALVGVARRPGEDPQIHHAVDDRLAVAARRVRRDRARAGVRVGEGDERVGRRQHAVLERGAHRGALSGIAGAAQRPPGRERRLAVHEPLIVGRGALEPEVSDRGGERPAGEHPSARLEHGRLPERPRPEAGGPVAPQMQPIRTVGADQPGAGHEPRVELREAVEQQRCTVRSGTDEDRLRRARSLQRAQREPTVGRGRRVRAQRAAINRDPAVGAERRLEMPGRGCRATPPRRGGPACSPGWRRTTLRRPSG